MTTDDLTISVHGFGGHPAVVLAGRLDAVEALRLRERLARPDLADRPDLVVDLTEVVFVDSAGLAALARARRDRVLVGGSVTLVRPSSSEAMRVFELTRFDEIFTFVDHRGAVPAS